LLRAVPEWRPFFLNALCSRGTCVRGGAPSRAEKPIDGARPPGDLDLSPATRSGSSIGGPYLDRIAPPRVSIRFQRAGDRSWQPLTRPSHAECGRVRLSVWVSSRYGLTLALPRRSIRSLEGVSGRPCLSIRGE